jgi:hypothetical protein
MYGRTQLYCVPALFLHKRSSKSPPKSAAVPGSLSWFSMNRSESNGLGRRSDIDPIGRSAGRQSASAQGFRSRHSSDLSANSRSLTGQLLERRPGRAVTGRVMVADLGLYSFQTSGSSTPKPYYSRATGQSLKRTRYPEYGPARNRPSGYWTCSLCMLITR